MTKETIAATLETNERDLISAGWVEQEVVDFLSNWKRSIRCMNQEDHGRISETLATLTDRVKMIVENKGKFV